MKILLNDVIALDTINTIIYPIKLKGVYQPMKKNEFVKSMSLTCNKIGFQLQKKSPEILVAAGIAGIIVSAVMACKATIKAQEFAEETKETLDEIHEAEENGITKAGNPYSTDDKKKDLAIAYIEAGKKYAKMYAPSILLGAASVGCIVTSHKLMKERMAAVAAALSATDKAFKDYRGRVAERFGEQIEKELRYNIKAKEIKETTVDEDGKEKKVKVPADVATVEGWDPSNYSPYARIFDETNPQWSKDAEANRFYLSARQHQATDMLRARGHLLLNEVYDMLGFPRTKAGAIVGWLYDPKRPELGDSYVDFGMYDIRRPSVADFINGHERSIILDFNVVGDILNSIEDHQAY